MKKILLLFSLLMFMNFLFAQNNLEKDFNFSVGPEVALPMENLHTAYTIGIGAFGQSEYIISEAASLSASVSVMHFFDKVYTATNESGPYKTRKYDYTMIPVLGGIKYYFGELKLYGRTQVGVVIDSHGVISAAFDLRLGTETKKIDWSLGFFSAYRKGSSTSFLGARAGYRF